LIAFELLNFIHRFIEDVGDAIDPYLSDKPLHVFLSAFLDTKESQNLEKIVNHIYEDISSPNIQIQHAISMFFIIVAKIQERE
jgi:hypothetical protein